MRRDMDLVRSILKAVANAQGDLDGSALTDATHDLQDIAYHVDILEEGGLIEGQVIRDWGGTAVRVTIFRLTWDGNEFLDAVSNDKVWNKVKLKVSQFAGAASLAIFKALAEAELTKLLMP